MCLVSNWSFPRLSLKPILCYKIVRVVEHNKLMGIQQKDYKYNIDKLNKCSLFPIRGKIVHNNLLYRQVIEGGYFHFMDSMSSIKLCLPFFAHNNKPISLFVWNEEINKYKLVYECDYQSALMYRIRNFFAFECNKLQLTSPVYSRKVYKLGFIGPHYMGNSYKMLNYKARKIFDIY